MHSNIIISGASGNLGKDVVQKLADLGHGIYAISGSHGKDIFDNLSQVHVQTVDLTDSMAASDYVENTISNAGPVQAGVFLAGGYAPGKMEDTHIKDIERMLRINFYTAFNLVKPLMAQFKIQGGGQFIFIGARPALIAEQGAGNFAYSLSKSLIFEMAELINAEGESQNITATVIVPSTIDTTTNREAMPDADFSKWIPTADIAETIAFVLGETGKKMRQTVIKLYNQA